MEKIRPFISINDVSNKLAEKSELSKKICSHLKNLPTTTIFNKRQFSRSKPINKFIVAAAFDGKEIEYLDLDNMEEGE